MSAPIADALHEAVTALYRPGACECNCSAPDIGVGILHEPDCASKGYPGPDEIVSAVWPTVERILVERGAALGESAHLRMVLGWLRSDARRGMHRRLHPGGQQTGPSAWEGASMHACLSVIRTVDDAIGPEPPPEPSQPFKVATQ